MGTANEEARAAYISIVKLFAGSLLIGRTPETAGNCSSQQLLLDHLNCCIESNIVDVSVASSTVQLIMLKIDCKFMACKQSEKFCYK